MDAVVVDGLDVTRGGRPVLQDLALRVPEGRPGIRTCAGSSATSRRPRRCTPT